VNVNVVIIGHVDHGKSTLIGRPLHDSKSVVELPVREIPNG
jgi:sulfate adenylyltransferase subunit 1 (EFTu-like GTPase family)